MRMGASARVSTVGVFLSLLLQASVGASSESVPAPVEEIEIVTYHVQTLVISRYAITTISCKIRNPTSIQREALFSVLLPINALISNLTIEAGGRNYSSIVKEKEEARLSYEMAKIKNTNAAIIHQQERETSRFRIDVSVAAKDEVIFYLTYEELLERSLGNYTLRINVHPNYPVRDVFVDVTVHETRAISLLQVIKVPGGDDFFGAVSEWREGIKTARLQFDPDPGALPQKIPLHGQLVIQYDVERSLDSGDVQIEDGYFVHFFAPVELQHTPKHITFLIDTSGSMEGTKLEQVKDALKRILLDLNKGDAYSIVEFASNAKRLTTARYSSISVRKAAKVIDSLHAEGGTNIDEGLKIALTASRSPPRISAPHWCSVPSRKPERKGPIWPPDVLSVEPKEDETVMSHIVVLLTDGQTTEGATSHNEILKNVIGRNKYGSSIFSLGFGEDADMNLLEKLSLQNGGFSRKIYEDYDASDQLQNFYESLATPLLLDVKFSYSPKSVILDSLTNTQFYNYFMGTELVVSGQLVDRKTNGIRANITGQGRNGEFMMGVNDWNTVLPPDHHLLGHLHLAPTFKSFMSRLWGFYMVKNLLAKEKAAMKKNERESAKRKALHLALKYHFVTPLTSLVVVQPDSEKCKEYEDDFNEYYYDDDLEKDLKKLKPKSPSEEAVDKPTSLAGNMTVIDVSDGKEDAEEMSQVDGEVIDEDHLNSGSMRSYDLSPKIYSPYDTNGVKHPDDQLLEELQRKTYSAFSASSRTASIPKCHLLLWVLVPSFTVLHFLLNRVMCTDFFKEISTT